MRQINVFCVFLTVNINVDYENIIILSNFQDDCVRKQKCSTLLISTCIFFKASIFLKMNARSWTGRVLNLMLKLSVYILCILVANEHPNQGYPKFGGPGLVGPVGVLGPLQLNFESLHANLKAVHCLDGGLCTSRVIKRNKP